MTKKFSLDVNDIHLPIHEKKKIKLVPINPSVNFATTSSSTVTNDSNPSSFVPIIDVFGKKYFPVYFKQPSDEHNQVRFGFFSLCSESIIYQLQNTSTIPPAPPFPKSKIHVERLTISQINLVPVKGNQKQSIKIPPHAVTRHSPAAYKHLRAKTVRIGNIRWPPPLNTDTTISDNGEKKSVRQCTQQVDRVDESLFRGMTISLSI